MTISIELEASAEPCGCLYCAGPVVDGCSYCDDQCAADHIEGQLTEAEESYDD